MKIFSIARFVSAAVLATAGISAMDPSVLPLVAPEAKAIIGVDLDRVLTSPLGQRLLAEMKIREDDLRKLSDVLGFDPRRDLREIVISASSLEGGPQAAKPLMIVRGNFNPAKIEGLTSMGANVRVHKGVTLLSGRRASDPWVAVLNGNLIVIGDEAQTTAAIDRFQTAGKTSELAGKSGTLASRYDLWLLTDQPVSSLMPRSSGESERSVARTPMIQGIERLAAGIRLGANVELGGEAQTRSAKDALALVDAIQFLASMAQGNVGPGSPMHSLIESLKMTAEGSSVHFALTAPQAELDRLLGSRSLSPRKR